MTIHEFANKYLTEPERLRYLYNNKNKNNCDLGIPISIFMKDEEHYVYSRYGFIENAFQWCKTPEDHRYWNDIANRL